MFDFDGSIESFKSLQSKYGTELTPKQAQRMADVVPKDLIVFHFDGGILTNGQVVSRDITEWLNLILLIFGYNFFFKISEAQFAL